MIIRDMFEKKIDRPINGVIKVDEEVDKVIEQEVGEYVITNELKKHFITFFSYYADALDVPTAKVGSFDTELVEEFWMGFARSAACNLHIRKIAGTNSHHIIEGAFKSAARSMRDAVKIEEAFADEVPSTKGVL